ncbi:MAG: hypothetical protein K2Q22_11170 [Cytophagales bacterium]|nr:hypothetical protein [Cytophagales bacterium]
MMANEILKKLQFKDNPKALIVNAPPEYINIVSSVDHETKFDLQKQGQYTFVQIFAKSQAELEGLIVQVAPAGVNDCVFWACYPKGGGKIKSDIKRETVWKAFDLIGLQAVSQVSIDETWSALRGRPIEKVGK